MITRSVSRRRQDESHFLNYYSVADPGEGPGGPSPPLFLDQTEAQRGEKEFLDPPPPPPPSGPFSQGLDPALLFANIILNIRQKAISQKALVCNN